jgi:pimeloyl-ACP methyl ester carboxylesterase
MRKILTALTFTIVLSLLLTVSLAINGQIKNRKNFSGEKLVPVILLHGIGGSDLRQKTGKGIFTDGGFPNDVLKSIAGDPQKLQFNEDGKPRTDVFESNNIHAVGFYDVPGRNITDLSKFLREEGYEINKNLYEFAYDFRYSVFDTAVKLGEFINRVKQETGAEQVDLIGHSMGGLIAKAYIADESKSANVRNLIFVGTPHLGAPKAFKALRYGDDLGVAIIDGCKLKRVAHNMPSMFNLLPGKKYFAVSGEGYFDDEDDLDNDGVRGLLDYERMLFNLEKGKETKCRLRPEIDSPPFNNLSSKLLRRQTVEFHDALDDWTKPQSVRVYNIVGYGVKTLKSMRESGGKLTGLYTTEGDGTVPLWSAEAAPCDATFYVNLKILDTEHSQMIGNKHINRQIINLIRRGPGIYAAEITQMRPAKSEFKLRLGK